MTQKKAKSILLQIEAIIAHKKAACKLAEKLDKSLENCETVHRENHFHVYSEKALQELAAVLGKEVKPLNEGSRSIGFWHDDIWIFTLEESEEK